MKARTKFTVITMLDAHQVPEVVVVGEDAGFILGGRDASGKYQQLETDKLSRIRPWEQQHGFKISYRTYECFADVDEDNGNITDIDMGWIA